MTADLDLLSSPSPNFGDRRGTGPVDMLVLHYTGMESGEAALQRLRDPQAQVSAHYMIDQEGQVFQLVAEDHRAWHAGVAFWQGETDVNSRSIGIELVNPGHEWGYCDFPEPQILALEKLASQILARHPIPACNVVGHSDVAPTRKMDPGELFPWDRLAASGIGIWPDEADFLDMTDEGAKTNLERVGYDMSDWRAALRAFQRHYRPSRVTGRLDAETARKLLGLAEWVEAQVGLGSQ